MSGNLWMFSDYLDEEDIEFARHSFFTVPDGMRYYGINEKPFYRIAREAGALYKISNNMIRINREIFEEYLRATQKGQNIRVIREMENNRKLGVKTSADLHRERKVRNEKTM